MYQVTWMNRRGAGCLRDFEDAAELETFLADLRRPATVRDAGGNRIGEVWREDGRWLWFYERRPSHAGEVNHG